jgi:lipoprotein-anchoring transpeptidase ErfK/SrfK
MRVTFHGPWRRAVAAGALLLAACTVSDRSDTADSAALAAKAAVAPAPDTTAAAAMPAPAPPPTPTAAPTTAAESSAMALTMGAATAVALSDLRLEVDLAARRLHVIKGDRRTASHPVAVGSPEWPTKTGEWYVRQVVFNPEWIPPDESWAEQRERRAPGDPKNPLGRAQLIYDPPRSIHGTNEPASIGKAVSHGSIRLSNAVVVQLARQALEEGGVTKDDAWFRRVQENPTQKEVVDLARQIPIRVY